MKILFVGIHNKPNTPPLDSKTKSGKLIDKVIAGLEKDECIKTNLFDCDYIPIDNVEDHKMNWIKKYNPSYDDKVILLGDRAHRLFPKDVKSKIIKIKHPSSIWSKKAQEEYISDILKKIME